MEKKTIKQNGGKREGSGRKKAKHTIASEKAREFLVNSIIENLSPIVSAQIDAAKGLSYSGKDGKVYTKLPNTKVGEYLLNQMAGKARENIELGGDVQKPMIIRLDV